MRIGDEVRAKASRDAFGKSALMEARPFRVTSFTMHPRVLKLLKKTADGHNVAMSGLVNLAIARLLEDKSPRQIEMLLKREGVKRRRALD